MPHVALVTGVVVLRLEQMPSGGGGGGEVALPRRKIAAKMDIARVIETARTLPFTARAPHRPAIRAITSEQICRNDTDVS